MVPRVAAVCLVLLAVAGCTTEKDPGPPKPSPQQSPAPQDGALVPTAHAAAGDRQVMAAL